MASTQSRTKDEPGDVVVDEFIQQAESSESGALRNLFDLRIIIGALFTLYGVYLTIHGIFDGAAALEKAAGVRINLWTGLAMLALGLGFLLWARLRPLSVREIAEAQTQDDDGDFLTEEQRAARGHAGTGGH
jgi:hypothetical protein